MQEIDILCRRCPSRFNFGSTDRKRQIYLTSIYHVYILYYTSDVCRIRIIIPMTALLVLLHLCHMSYINNSLLHSWTTAFYCPSYTDYMYFYSYKNYSFAIQGVHLTMQPIHLHSSHQLLNRRRREADLSLCHYP